MNRFLVARFGPIVIVALLVGTCVAWTINAGRDLNFDLFNYHFYTAYAYVNDRLGQDFFAANIQTYLNPLAYLPFYAMVQAGWPSVLIGITLACIQCLSIVALYFLAYAILPPDAHRGWYAALCTVLGIASPIFWAELGTSFIDLSTAIPVLIAVWLLVEKQVQRDWKFWLAGGLIGIACGLKLTNVIYAAPAVALLYIHGQSPWKFISRCGMYGVGATIGGLLVQGRWGWSLYREFGNPFFPFFNALFRSPDFPVESIRHSRFLPDSTLEAFLLPFRMADYQGWVYTETIAPDIRPAALLIMLLALLAMVVMRRFRKAVGPTTPEPDDFHVRLIQLWIFLAATWILWIFTSANGRYAIGLLMMLGPVIGITLLTLFTQRRAMLVIASIAMLQLGHFASAGNPHWSPAEWSENWIEIDVPERLRRDAFLYISLGLQSHSFISAYVNEKSVFINALGQHSIQFDGPGGERLKEALGRFPGRIRVLSKGPAANATKEDLKRYEAFLDNAVQRFGMQADMRDCERIEVEFGKKSRTSIWACNLVLATVDDKSRQEREIVVQALNQIEDLCPQLFKPARAVTERGTHSWTRHYLGTEVFLSVSDERVYFKRPRSLTAIDLGPLRDWLTKPVPAVHCPTL